MISFVALAAVHAATQSLSMFDPASPPAASIRHFFLLVLAVTGGIFIVVEGVLLYSIYRFRHRGETHTTEPPQVYGSKNIELAWTVAPALVVFVLVLVMARFEWQVRVDANQPPLGSRPLRVTVIGHQWWWEYVYTEYDGRKLGPNGAGFTTANELHVPVSEEGVPRPVYLTLKSADVCHSFWVPRLAGKTDLIPGKTNEMWFQPWERGLFLGQCAEYCGTQHANMLLRVIAEPADAFERWLENEDKPAVEPTDAAGRRDRDAFLAQTCVSCHPVRGTPARGTYAPDLTHLMSRRTLASGMVSNTPTELRNWVKDPQDTKPGCLMAPFALGEADLDRLVRYLLSLR
jgi:cytochrome c oxidase subunit 2